MGKFRGSAQNMTFHGKLWSLKITGYVDRETDNQSRDITFILTIQTHYCCPPQYLLYLAAVAHA